jgi:hypothetical protein
MGTARKVSQWGSTKNGQMATGRLGALPVNSGAGISGSSFFGGMMLPAGVKLRALPPDGFCVRGMMLPAGVRLKELPDTACFTLGKDVMEFFAEGGTETRGIEP